MIDLDRAEMRARNMFSNLTSHKYKYSYVESYKTGSTYVRYVLSRIEQIPSLASFNPDTQGKRDLPLIAIDKMQELFDQGYYIFTNCKNPITRLFSGWADKIVTGEYASISDRSTIPSGAEFSIENIRKWFESFVVDLYHLPNKVLYDRHFLPQYLGLFPDQIPYSAFMHAEELEQSMRRFMTEIIKVTIDPKTLMSSKLNVSPVAYSSEYITDTSLDIITQLYDRDFDLFNYPRVAPIVPVKPLHLEYITDGSKRNLWS